MRREPNARALTNSGSGQRATTEASGYVSESVPPEGAEKALPPDLGEFLIEFSIGVHRYGMYPTGHPALEPSASNIVRSLDVLFDTRTFVAIGVAQRRLVVEGVLTEQGHPVFSDLARRLSDRQLGAVSFRRGIKVDEIAGLLQVLAEEVDRGGRALDPEDTTRWPNIQLHAAGYEKLELREGDEGEVGTGLASSLWLSLAQAVLAADEAPTEAPSPSTLAKGIATRSQDRQYDEAVMGYLLQLAAELKGQTGSEAGTIRRSVSELLAQLDEETLARLLSFGGDFAQRSRFLLDANDDMEVDSVVKLLHAAATSSEQTISNSMTRVLTKLAAHAGRGKGVDQTIADANLREQVEALVNDWELEDPNPEQYTSTLDAMAQAGPVLKLHEEGEETRSGSVRVLEMALELDVFGPIVSKAVTDLMEGGGADVLVARLEAAPEAGTAVRSALSELLPQERLSQLLAGGHLTEPMLRSLMDLMEGGGAERLLEVLIQSEVKSVRRHVFDVLADMGPSVVESALAHLDDPRWFVQRNMLALLQRLGGLPEDFDPFPFLDNDDARVRREALPLALQQRDRRARALVAALRDSDGHMVRIALLALHRRLPDAAVPTLVHRVVSNEELSEDLRVLGISLAGKTGSPLALTALTKLCTAGRTFFGRRKLAPGTPVVIAALRALAQSWPDERSTQQLLGLAARSKDPGLRESAWKTRQQASSKARKGA